MSFWGDYNKYYEEEGDEHDENYDDEGEKDKEHEEDNKKLKKYDNLNSLYTNLKEYVKDQSIPLLENLTFKKLEEFCLHKRY